MLSRYRILTGMLTAVLIGLAIPATAQDLSKAWDAAKPEVSKMGLPTDKMPAGALGYQTDTLDVDSFRDLKATFEGEPGVKAMVLIESGKTWILERNKSLVMPLVWFGAVGGVLTTIGLLQDNGAAVVGGLVTGAAAGAVSYFFFSDTREVRFEKNSYSGKAAVFIFRN